MIVFGLGYQLNQKVVFINVLVDQNLLSLLRGRYLKTFNVASIEMNICWAKRIIEEQFLEEVGKWNNFIIIKISFDRSSCFLRELLLHFFIDQMNSFIPETSFSIVTALVKNFWVYGTIIKIVHDLNGFIFICFHLNGFLNNILNQIFPSKR